MQKKIINLQEDYFNPQDYKAVIKLFEEAENLVRQELTDSTRRSDDLSLNIHPMSVVIKNKTNADLRINNMGEILTGWLSLSKIRSLYADLKTVKLNNSQAENLLTKIKKLAEVYDLNLTYYKYEIAAPSVKIFNNLLDFHNKFNENRSILSALKGILSSSQTNNSERKTKIINDFFTLEALLLDSIKWEKFYIEGKENKYWSESFDNYKKYILVSGGQIINSVLEELKIITDRTAAEQKNNIQELIFVLEKMLKEYRLTGITSSLEPKRNMSLEQEELLNILAHISERPASFHEVRQQIKNLMISIHSQEGGKALREVFACFDGLQCLFSDTKPDRKNTDPAKIGLWQCLQNFSNNIEMAWEKIVRDLRELGIIMVVPPGHLKEEIHAAIRDDKFSDLKNLVLQGADLNYLYEEITPLMLAIMSDRDEIFDFLVENNVDLEAKDTTMGSSALLFALVWHREDMAISLLNKGADPEIKNKNGQIPLVIATQLGLKKVVRKLLERKASLNVQNKDGLTPLEIARKMNMPEIVRMLENEQELRKHWEFM